MKGFCFTGVVGLCVFFLFSCSSVKYTIRTGLPKHKTSKTFEQSYPKVWSATYNAVASNADIEVAEESEGIIKTAWNYGISDINIADYKVDDKKRVKPLRLRYRYTVFLKRITGGVRVVIDSDQDFEKLNPEDIETPSDSWVSTVSSTSREHELLAAIQTELLK